MITRSQFIQFMQKSAMYKKADMSDALTLGGVGAGTGYGTGALLHYLKQPTLRGYVTDSVKRFVEDPKELEEALKKIPAEAELRRSLKKAVLGSEEEYNIARQIRKYYNSLANGTLSPQQKKLGLDSIIGLERLGENLPKNQAEAKSLTQTLSKLMKPERKLLRDTATATKILRALKGNKYTYLLGGAGLLGMGALGAGLK